MIEDACLPPDKEISTPSGWTRIADISIGDQVLGNDGNFHNVTKVSRRRYKGEIVTVTPWSMGFPVSATPEHPVLAVKAYKGNGQWTIRPTFEAFEKCGKADRYYREAISWLPVGALCVGDFLLTPIPSFSQIPLLEIEQPASHSWNAKLLPQKVELSEGLLYLCGLYIAEGSTYKECVQVANRDGRVIEQYSSALNSSLGLEYTVVDRGRLLESRTFSKPLSQLFTSWFGDHAINKRIPAWIMALPADQVDPFMRGLWDGDGSNYLNPYGRRIFAYRTISKQLARQVCLLLLKLGIVSTIQNQDNTYDVRVQSDHSGKLLGRLVNEEWNQTKGTSRSTACFIHNGYLWVPIHSVISTPYAGWVHNLEVDSAHSYMSEFTIFHNCQAHGALYKGKRTGSLGVAAAFSFYPSKNMTVLGDGGMVTTNDEKIAKFVSRVRDGGRVSWYEHDIVGYTSRMTSVSAAIGRVQLKHLEEWNEKRRHIAVLYMKYLEGEPSIVLPPAGDKDKIPVYHQFVIRARMRDELKAFLDENGVQCGVHYPIPIHLQPLYINLFGFTEGSYPKSEKLATECLSLPMHPFISDSDAKIVCESIRSFYEKR